MTKHSRFFGVLCLICNLLLPVCAEAMEVVVMRIEITGNIKTQPETILQELPFSDGDVVTDELLEQATQAVKNLGLFEAVEIRKKPAQSENSAIVAEVIVVEKHYNFILPKLGRNGDGDITTGIVWRSDNLFGKNQQSKITLAYRSFKDTDEDNETELKWEYDYPRITNTPYSLSFIALNEDTQLEETIGQQTGEYDRDRSLFQLLVGRWLNHEGPSRGITLKAGPLWDKYEHEHISGAKNLLPDITVQALIARLDGNFVHDHLLSRSGHHYGYEIIWADKATGSDINFLQHRVFYKKYIPLGDNHSNLNFQINMGYITRSLLGPPQFKVGGSRSLRGYSRDEVEGNSFAILNVEWLRPILNRETLRAALIFDAGNAWNNSRDASFSDLKYSAGFGLRWKLKRFVRTDVRLDIAHGFSDGGETKAYLATRATF